ncbi:MAG: Tetratricopeptide (TPR) repeat/Tetratricopeptide (TPR) repeat [Verrucomicrobia bacterium]|nr:MAG: Tetratricopeptide (TPR) repeat/Tetratricopeptide (TPR) repeat [Verrucomicrobiota bacterium]
MDAAKSGSKTLPSTAAPAAPPKVVASDALLPGPLYADPYPSPNSVPAPDLLNAPERDVLSEAYVHFALAVIAEAQEDSERASSLFNKALELDPSNARLASRIAADLLQQKKTEEAVRLLKTTHQAAPKELGPAVELARIYLTSLRQPDSALTYAERAYKLAPGDFTAISTLVEVCASARLTQRLEETLRRTLALSRTDVNFWLRAGDLFRNALSLRGTPPGKTQLERVNALYRKALDLEPNDPLCLQRAADHFTLTQQYAEACRFYDRANSLHLQENKAHSLPIGQKWARALVLNEQPDAALDLLEELIKENPSAADPRELAGELYLRQGQLIAALGHFRLALDAGGSKMEDHVRLIQLQLRLKRGDEAAETALKARSLFPEAPGLTMLLAVALGEAKRHQESIQAFEAAEQEFSKDRSEALDASFYLTYGAAAERAGMLEQAAKLLKKSISLAPETAAEALNYLGFMWVDRNINLEEAGNYIRKALGLRPNHPAYLDSLGWWYYRSGDLPAAVRELRKALEKIRREEAPEVYEHLGEVQEKLGHLPEAISAWESALELDPGLESVKERLQRVRPTPQTQNP